MKVFLECVDKLYVYLFGEYMNLLGFDLVEFVLSEDG